MITAVETMGNMQVQQRFARSAECDIRTLFARRVKSFFDRSGVNGC